MSREIFRWGVVEKMLVKAGVDISRLNREIRRALPVAEGIMKGRDDELVITSTYEGNHGAGSLHYSNDAFDCTARNELSPRAANEIGHDLGPDYDVVAERDHIHVEWEQKQREGRSTP
jgi:hypothetical protein